MKDRSALERCMMDWTSSTSNSLTPIDWSASSWQTSSPGTKLQGSLCHTMSKAVTQSTNTQTFWSLRPSARTILSFCPPSSKKYSEGSVHSFSSTKWPPRCISLTYIRCAHMRLTALTTGSTCLKRFAPVSFSLGLSCLMSKISISMWTLRGPQPDKSSEWCV